MDHQYEMAHGEPNGHVTDINQNMGRIDDLPWEYRCMCILASRGKMAITSQLFSWSTIHLVLGWVVPICFETTEP